MPAIYKRELMSYFTTPLGYVFAAIFCGFSGLFLWEDCLRIGSTAMGGVFNMMFFIVMITIPLLTMRTLAEDKKRRTDRLTLTSPVSIFGIVAGKFASAYTVFLGSSLILPVYAAVLAATCSQQGEKFGWVPFWGYYTGLLLIGAVFTAIGIFVSSLTESQMVAAVSGIGLNIFICLFDMLSAYVDDETLADVINSLSVYYKYNEFTQGIYSLKNIVFFLSLTAIFCFLAGRVIERRRRV